MKHGKYSKKGKTLRLWEIDIMSGAKMIYCETEEQAKAVIEKLKKICEFDYKINYLG